MITSNVLQRTFRIRCSDSQATCFTINIGEKQFLVTASHLLGNRGTGETIHIEISHRGQWLLVPAEICSISHNGADIAILALEIPISPTHPLPVGAEGLVLGQQVYFCGFTTLALHKPEEKNRMFPLPLVRQGIVSAMEFHDNGLSVFVLDGHNIAGFSGGPVVFKKPNVSDYFLLGVISGYRFQTMPVHHTERATSMYVETNSGLVVAHGLESAVERIESTAT